MIEKMAKILERISNKIKNTITKQADNIFNFITPHIDESSNTNGANIVILNTILKNLLLRLILLGKKESFL